MWPAAAAEAWTGAAGLRPGDYVRARVVSANAATLQVQPLARLHGPALCQ